MLLPKPFPTIAQHEPTELTFSYSVAQQTSSNIVERKTRKWIHLLFKKQIGWHILAAHSYQHIIVGDLNEYLVARTFEESFTVLGMRSHVEFSIHISRSLLDSFLTHFPESMVTCSTIDNVGLSDDMASLSIIRIILLHDYHTSRTI